jgi:hypothetical protein
VPPPERRLLTWDEVGEMARWGIDFGSHTVTHPYLDALPRERLRYELERSREILAERLRRPPAGLAYPDGRHDAEVVRAARDAGYAYGVTTMTGPNRPGEDPFRLRRFDGSFPFHAGGDLSFPVLWAELLGVWDALFLRRWRAPERFTAWRPAAGGAGRA